MATIDSNILIEDLVAKYPASVAFLLQKGIQCIVCGEPIWGTLENAIKEKGFATEAITAMVEELNHWVNSEERK